MVLSLITQPSLERIVVASVPHSLQKWRTHTQSWYRATRKITKWSSFSPYILFCHGLNSSTDVDRSQQLSIFVNHGEGTVLYSRIPPFHRTYRAVLPRIEFLYRCWSFSSKLAIDSDQLSTYVKHSERKRRWDSLTAISWFDYLSGGSCLIKRWTAS